MEQDFYASGPNQKWAGDITYLRTDEGWLYLAVVIDLWSRAVIGWSMSPRMTAQLACDALQMALWRRKRPRNVIVHTDRGGQYCSADYQAQLKRHNLRGSMSAKGCCYDNACVESFFHSLKVECIHGEHFISREIMRATVFIISNVITIGGGGTVGVAASVRNNLKTRTSLRPVSILRG
ncbi:integrase core domain protein [Escherichia coli 3.3884]|nr:integrase core domain protein [Escherichia coli 3.3884]